MKEEERLHELIERYSFEELTADDRNFVLLHLTQDKYELQRQVLLSANELFEEESLLLAPDLGSKKEPQIRMKASADQETQKIPWFLVWLHWKVPAYSLILPVLLIMAAWISWPMITNGDMPERAAGEIRTEYITKIDTVVNTRLDTVFIDRETPVEKVKFIKVPEIRYVEVAKVPVTQEIEESDPALGKNHNLASATEVLREQLKKIGKSARDNPELDQFVISVP